MSTATKNKDKTKLKLQPLGDRIVVKREESLDRTDGGIYLPDSAKDKPTRGTVVSVGDGKLLENGTRGAMQVKLAIASCSPATQARILKSAMKSTC